MCLLSNNIHDYHFVSQGKTTIPNVDDGEEFRITDVSFRAPNRGNGICNAYSQLIPSRYYNHALHCYHSIIYSAVLISSYDVWLS